MKWTLPEGFQGLIFDCDGTLVDSMPLHYQVWKTVLGRHGLDFPENLFYQYAGLPIEDIINRLSESQGVAVNAREVGQERDDLFHSYPDSALVPVRAVVEIADRYRGEIPMAVATGSTRESATASLKAIGVLDWFAGVFSSIDVGRSKPAPDVFLAAADHIGVAPQKCVAFEDGEAGMVAARAAGMMVVDVRPWLERSDEK